MHGGGGQALIDPAPTTRTPGAGSSGPSVRAACSSPASTRDTPARSIPVSAWARLPTRSACWNSALSAPAGLPVGLRGAQRVAQLAEDLALADGHRVQAAGHGERRARPRGPRSARRGARVSSASGTPAAAASASPMSVDGRRGRLRRRRRPRPGCRWRGRPPRRRARRCGPRGPARRRRSASSATDSSTVMRRGPVGQSEDDDAHWATSCSAATAAAGRDAPRRALGEGLALLVESEDLQLGGQVHLAHVDAVGDGRARTARSSGRERTPAATRRSHTSWAEAAGVAIDPDRDAALGGHLLEVGHRADGQARDRLGRRPRGRGRAGRRRGSRGWRSRRRRPARGRGCRCRRWRPASPGSGRAGGRSRRRGTRPRSRRRARRTSRGGTGPCAAWRSGRRRRRRAPRRRRWRCRARRGR